jgi:hypothetical protein
MNDKLKGPNTKISKTKQGDKTISAIIYIKNGNGTKKREHRISAQPEIPEFLGPGPKSENFS